MSLFFSFCCFGLESAPAEGQETPKSQETVPSQISGENPLFTQIGDNLFLMGNVKIDVKAKEISFPASINMYDGQLEYLIVTSIGKTHESLLLADIEPYHLQAAMLLLGIKGGQFEDQAQPAPSALNSEALSKMPEITGSAISITVSWDENGAKRTLPVEKWVVKEPDIVMSEGPWTYSGSRFFEGAYMAQENGSIASIITDPDAMINNPRPGHADDKIWTPNTAVIPKLSKPLEITIKLSSPASHAN